jgi:hypothetical protein
MDHPSLLIVAMAEQCRALILESDTRDLALPKPLQTKHLVWMCNQIHNHVEDWSSHRLNRWIGFLQCAMIAHGMLTFDGAKSMFDNAKVAYGDIGDDMVDHLDSTNSFACDIGGES